MKTDEKEVTAARQLLILGAQKAWTYYKKYSKLHQKLTEDALEQAEDQEQSITNILPPPSTPLVVSNILYKEGNKLLLEQLAK